jgi:ribonuclease D
MDIPVQIISQPGQLDAAVKQISVVKEIAIDVELNSRHRYPEQFCLIQIATPDKIYIIDTISIREITPLKEILSDVSITKVFHASDYDIRSLDRHYGYHVRNVFDTSIAAHFIGIEKIGLGNLLESILNIKIDKDPQLQKADWGRRPLSEKALEYAADDVRYLFELKKKLNKQILELGRSDWVKEEFDRLEDLRYEVPDPKTAFLSVKGSHKLDGKSLALLKNLYAMREKEALRQGIPPSYVLPDHVLVSISDKPEADLSSIEGINPNVLSRYGQNLKKAIEDGLAESPIHRNHDTAYEDMKASALPFSKQDEYWEKLRDWRTSIGTSLSLDPSLVWPTASLKQLSRNPDSFEEELKSSLVRNWQRDSFAFYLSAFLKTLK